MHNVIVNEIEMVLINPCKLHLNKTVDAVKAILHTTYSWLFIVFYHSYKIDCESFAVQLFPSVGVRKPDPCASLKCFAPGEVLGPTEIQPEIIHPIIFLFFISYL
jgi:hypothetical protein